MLGETLPAQGYLGAALVVAGVVVASLPGREGDQAAPGLDEPVESMADGSVPVM